MSRAKSSLTSLIILLVFAVVAGALYFNRQWVVDELSIWQFKPSSEVTALAEGSSLNDNGKFIYYASQPSIESTQHFNDVCGTTEQSTAILGCYSAQRIYVYNVTDVRLDGIKEVTAAHEMLHAAYQRLSDADRKNVDSLLDVEYNKLKDDAKFAERIAFYARSEPGERDNELHSIIGTEVDSVSPALESYYSRYFTDRKVVLGHYSKYSTVFKEIEDKSNALSASLTTLGSKIEKNTAQYNSDVKSLNQDILDFNTRANNGSFSSQSEFASERAALSARTSALDVKRAQIAADLVTYDAQRKELQAISSESAALNRSIDSKLAPAPSL
ncbi:MAG: hypothetical protein ABIQ04_01565 [Candidatus Saccharimonadales bacterium]